jgi:hypothetical protein
VQHFLKILVGLALLYLIILKVVIDNEMFAMNNIRSEDFFMPGYKTTDEYAVFYQFEE